MTLLWSWPFLLWRQAKEFGATKFLKPLHFGKAPSLISANSVPGTAASSWNTGRLCITVPAHARKSVTSPMVPHEPGSLCDCPHPRWSFILCTVCPIFAFSSLVQVLNPWVKFSSEIYLLTVHRDLCHFIWLFSFNIMCASVRWWEYAHSDRCPWNPEENTVSLGVTNACELPNLGAGYKTCFLCKNSTHSQSVRHPCSSRNVRHSGVYNWLKSQFRICIGSIALPLTASRIIKSQSQILGFNSKTRKARQPSH